MVLAAVALVPACKTNTGHVADLPPACLIGTPEVQIVERRIYVGISSEFTTPEPIAEGPLSECPAVAADRRAALERANAKLRAIATKQGTEVEP
ncbi:hypothetical protein WCE55_02210 [Luteimonas sp. MJ293]|uniref:hypothetical protein n=1 Tax=Luteimonas sp. MJ146 TaxID=3129240 RepID=UPI0031BA0BC6